PEASDPCATPLSRQNHPVLACECQELPDGDSIPKPIEGPLRRQRLQPRYSWHSRGWPGTVRGCSACRRQSKRPVWVWELRELAWQITFCFSCKCCRKNAIRL